MRLFGLQSVAHAAPVRAAPMRATARPVHERAAARPEPEADRRMRAQGRGGY